MTDVDAGSATVSGYEFMTDPKRRLLFQQEKLILDLMKVICDLMGDQGMTHFELARKLGYPPPAISHLLGGSSDMTLSMVAKFFDALGHEASFGSRPYSAADRPGPGGVA